MSLPSVQEIEAASLVAWPALEDIRDGSWSVRFSRGYTNRANSVQSLDPADDSDVEARINRHAADYRTRGLTPVFRVTPLAGPQTVSTLDTLGWAPFGHSLVMARELKKVARPVSAHTQYFEPADPLWWQPQRDMSEREGKDALGEVVTRITAPARGILLFGEDLEPVAAALVVNVEGIAMFLNVVVAAAARGQGLGRAVMNAGLNWATLQSKATTAALQVAADNEQAVPLYRSLGFEEIYQYHYRKPAA
ncbi:GNAT family N-acetyltransferase [Devosia sp. SL43]|uniref:GNAT family N-acetyltransferase n=1 Tax=Devosia sp. SL43 TaxID=2806348 RepID=UPI001F1C0D36|nr:GNAT family N-acetyltransferase [Devosia sp. SL43]UJW83957.1 GNAT family N-acetyltransferase [Devosia sp. SL43]